MDDFCLIQTKDPWTDPNLHILTILLNGFWIALWEKWILHADPEIGPFYEKKIWKWFAQLE